MARYSREQRRRAAELYERYEHSAADVIRELGYPSKEALRMWHRDWLEERRTGIPSSRGEHYSRYTDGQRRAACVCSMELWPVEHRVSVQLSGGF